MKGGVTTYQVVGDTHETLLAKVVNALADKSRVVSFEAVLLDSPLLEADRRTFTVRVETIHMSAVPIAVDMIDDSELWFQVKLDAKAPEIIFSITS